MHTGLKVAAYVVALAATFGTAYGAGTAIDPVAEPKPATHTEHSPQHPSGHAPDREAGHDSGPESEQSHQR
ncbi:hypothetical protein [Streptomyces buecherae]|uniref:hypothetical protein n=1 Tax=Streptomyces buecherae TaxID=2763006 RepID=UPI003648EF73